jgi:hypothetical protein
MDYGNLSGGLPDLADHTLFTKQHAGDEALFVVFYMGILDNAAKTLEAGRRIVDDVEYVRIIIPGDKNTINDRPASEQDKRRFAKQYGMFKEGKKEDEQISGTRLTDWPFLTRGQCEEFKYLGIRTVEQMAQVRDDLATKIPGLQSLKQNATVWLAKSKNAAEAAQQAKLMTDQASRIETLEKVVREQAERYEKLQTGMTAKA